jgi:hypothetical protein
MIGKRFDHREPGPQYTADDKVRIELHTNRCQEYKCDYTATHKVYVKDNRSQWPTWVIMRYLCSVHAEKEAEDHGGIKP